MNRWYESGLRFTCTRCGHCCTGAPGHVWVTGDEEEKIAALRGLPPEEFARKYVRQVGDRRSLIEQSGGDCVFLRADRTCEIHEVKPRQCVVFPFWPHTVSTNKNWDAAAQRCPGMGNGTLHTADEIDVLSDPATPKSKARETMARIQARAESGS